MTSEVVYAIYHPDSGLFYDGYGLSVLNAKTLLFNEERDACIHKINNRIVTRITWDYLKNIYKKPSYDINISKDDYNKTFQMFRNLQIVPINLEYNQA